MLLPFARLNYCAALIEMLVRRESMLAWELGRLQIVTPVRQRLTAEKAPELFQ
jgi:hypothetical protein